MSNVHKSHLDTGQVFGLKKYKKSPTFYILMIFIIILTVFIFISIFKNQNITSKLRTNSYDPNLNSTLYLPEDIKYSHNNYVAIIFDPEKQGNISSIARNLANQLDQNAEESKIQSDFFVSNKDQDIYDIIPAYYVDTTGYQSRENKICRMQMEAIKVFLTESRARVMILTDQDVIVSGMGQFFISYSDNNVVTGCLEVKGIKTPIGIPRALAKYLYDNKKIWMKTCGITNDPYNDLLLTLVGYLGVNVTKTSYFVSGIINKEDFTKFIEGVNSSVFPECHDNSYKNQESMECWNTFFMHQTVFWKNGDLKQINAFTNRSKLMEMDARLYVPNDSSEIRICSFSRFF